MTNQHQITLPNGVMQAWVARASVLGADLETILLEVARWGADQELEEFCAEVLWQEGSALAAKLRDRRRPKPPSLKGQALEALREAESTGCLYVNGRSDTIRRALEALPND